MLKKLIPILMLFAFPAVTHADFLECSGPGLRKFVISEEHDWESGFVMVRAEFKNSALEHYQPFRVEIKKLAQVPKNRFTLRDQSSNQTMTARFFTQGSSTLVKVRISRPGGASEEVDGTCRTVPGERVQFVSPKGTR